MGEKYSRLNRLLVIQRNKVLMFAQRGTNLLEMESMWNVSSKFCRRLHEMLVIIIHMGHCLPGGKVSPLEIAIESSYGSIYQGLSASGYEEYRNEKQLALSPLGFIHHLSSLHSIFANIVET